MKNKMRFMKFGFLAVGCVFCSLPACATLIISIEPVTAVPGSTGTFDVLLTDSGSPAVAIAGFNFEIQSSNPALSFVAAFTSTATANYIFSGNSLLGPEIDVQTSPTLIAADVAASGSTTLNSGDVVGLGQVSFNVSPTVTAGPITISFTGGAAGNNLSDPNGGNIPIDTFTSGTVDITGSPEPSSLLMMLAGVGVLAAWNRRRRA
jgi:hypothetical protein